jgi:16S rRNA (uracil1498-N3)-methyltransferase
MADRYFIESPITGTTARLTAAEAHHLLHVMRAQVGDTLTLFDGSGAEFAARVEHLRRAEVELSIVSRSEVNRELRVSIALGVAMPKGDRGRWLVEKATELGATRLVPLVAEHSNDRASPAALEKLRRAVIEASKQCGRNRLMEITVPQSLDTWLAADTEHAMRLIAHPSGSNCRDVLDENMSPQAEPRSVALAIGPEGGFTAAEIKLAETHGWHVVGLGPRILRIETAALALMSPIVVRIDETS